MDVVRASCFALILSLGLDAATPAARAESVEPHRLGLGIAFGEPSGISAKYWLNSLADAGESGGTALDGGLAYSFDSFVLVYADYLWHSSFDQARGSDFVQEIRPYLGVGAMLLLSSRTAGEVHSNYFDPGRTGAGLGVRIPLGFEWLARSSRLGIFLEIDPGLVIVPATYAFVNGQVGLRFYFR